MSNLFKKALTAVVSVITAVSISISAFAAPDFYYFYGAGGRDNRLSSAEIAELNAAVADIASLVDSSWPDVYKVLYINDYICTHVKYDTTLSVFYPYNAVFDGTCVCQGYAMLFDMVMEKLNIPCHAVNSDRLNHMWNMVKVDGSWYCLDVTWNDPVPDTPGAARHGYLLLSESTFRTADKTQGRLSSHDATDWTIYDDDVKDITTPYGVATSTKYDGVDWCTVSSPIYISGKYNYAIVNKVIGKYDENGRLISSVCDLSSAKWPVKDISNAYINESFSGFAGYNDRLYFNTSTEIKSVALDGTDEKTEYALTDAQKAEGNIFGFYMEGDKITYYLSNFYSTGVFDEYTPYTFTVPENHTHTYGTASYAWSNDNKTCTATRTCSKCGDVQDETANATTTTKAATCTASGSTVYTTKFTNTAFATQTKTIAIAATGHTSVSANNGKAATCTEAGKESDTKCSVCGATLTTGNTISALGHNYVEANDAVAATCTTAGKTASKTCSRCKDTVAGTAIAAKGHTSVSANNAKAATCTEAGKESDTKCSVCGVTLTTGKTIAAKGHTSVSANNGKAATCTEAGKESDTKCSTCGVTLTTGAIINAKGHTWDNGTVKTGAGCASSGVKEYKCTTCGATKTEATSATGHTVVTDKAVAATCTTAGLTEGSHCSVCGAVIKEQEIIAPSHKSISANNSKAATCTEAGKESDTKCSVCGVTLTTGKTIAPTGHAPVSAGNGKVATCTEAGKESDTKCSVCGVTLTTGAAIAAKGHTVVTDKAVAATCTADGKTEGSHCSECGTVIKAQTTVAKTGHTVVTDKAVAATCTTDGKTAGSHCSKCNAVIKAQTTVKATGHKYTDKVVAPTTTAQGYTLHTCSVCGDSYKDNYKDKLPAATTKVSAVTGLKLKGRASNALRIAWNKNTSADGYIVEMYKGGKWVRVQKIAKNSTVEWKQTGLAAGTAYKFRVKAYKMNGKTAVYSSYVTISARTNPSNVTGLKTLGRAKTAVRFGWTKNTSADGYIVEMYKGGKWVRAAKITKNSTVQYKKTGLKAGTTYKFRVRAYKMSGSTALYSGYTNYNIATTK